MAAQNGTLSGTWYCRHWYPNRDDTGEDTTENRMEAHQQGKDLVLQSEPNEEGSYMFVRLTVDDDVATGSWYESTSENGTFEGAQYSGAGQLLLAEDQQSMDGQWAGVGFDRPARKSRVYTGRWMLTRQSSEDQPHG